MANLTTNTYARGEIAHAYLLFTYIKRQFSIGNHHSDG